MRLVWLWVCLLIGLSLPGVAGAQGVRAAGPVIKISPGLIDLGAIPQESIRRTEAVIWNTGTDSLRITDVKTECGCTVPDVSKRVLAPGDSTLLKITFSSRHYHGDLFKRVTITSNDPASPQTRVKLKVTVLELLRVDPEMVQFGPVLRGTSPSQTVTIKAAREDSLVVEELLLSDELFTHELQPIDEPDSTGYHLVITIKPDAPLGDIKARPGIKTNLTRSPRTVTIRGHIHGFFRAKPARLSFGQYKAGAAKTETVRLEAQGEGQHRLLSVESSHELIDATIEVIEEGRIYEITVTCSPEIPPGQIRETLRIETDDPHQPETVLQVRANVRG